MTQAEKADTFDRIVEIIQEHFSLLQSQNNQNKSFADVEFGKVNAYRKICRVATGTDPL